MRCVREPIGLGLVGHTAAEVCVSILSEVLAVKHTADSIKCIEAILGRERHRAQMLAGLRERICCRLVCLVALVWVNHRLGRHSRVLVSCCA